VSSSSAPAAKPFGKTVTKHAAAGKIAGQAMAAASKNTTTAVAKPVVAKKPLDDDDLDDIFSAKRSVESVTAAPVF
jgi:hypothetical protein